MYSFRTFSSIKITSPEISRIAFLKPPCKKKKKNNNEKISKMFLFIYSFVDPFVIISRTSKTTHFVLYTRSRFVRRIIVLSRSRASERTSL